MNSMHALILIGIMSVTTIFLRAIPFLVFSKKTPDFVMYLGRVLPYASMAMLVVYCLKEVHLFQGNHGLPEILAVSFVIFVHKWKKNVLLSVFVSTIFYMFLVQIFF